MSQIYKLKPAFFSGDAINRVSTINYEADLTSEQLPVVRSKGGPTLVIAGAGSGKTRTVTYRVAYLVESGVPLENILLVTFTNKASREMTYRVEGLLKQPLQGLMAGTFHHIGNLILRKHAKLIGYNQNFTILDRSDGKDLLDRCVKEAGIDTKTRKFPKGDVLQDIYSYLCNTQIPLLKSFESKYAYLFEFQAEIKRVLELYEERKQIQNLMDFDDLLTKWLTLLVEHNEVREKYAQRFEHILVDEYQDTNLLQAQIIDLLASKHHNLMVVGDDSQSIYSFRGAEFRNIIDFPNKYQNAAIFKLELNHRSTPEILHFANDSIANAEERFEKNLKPVRKPGPAPVVVPFRDVYKQAAFVAQRILELHDAGMKLSDMAVVYRSHYHCLELQVELTRRSIPHEVRSGMRLFEEAHIKDVTSYLKVFHNPFDGLAWMRMLRLIPAIGNKTADKLWKEISKVEEPIKKMTSDEMQALVPRGAREVFSNFQVLLKALERMTESPSTMIQTILENGYSEYLKMTYPNYSMRQEELEELGNYAMEYKSLEGFLSSLALVGETSAEQIVSPGSEGEKDAVVLTTVHQAKGLEWRVVFVVWLAEGRFPSYKTFGNKKEEEEERRLFYVAITRSKDQLYLTYPLIYQSREGSVVMKASRFLKEISEHRYEKWEVEDEEPADEVDEDGMRVVEWKRGW